MNLQTAKRGKNAGMGDSIHAQPGHEPVRDISRPVSAGEYLFAAIQGSAGVPGTAVELVTVLETSGVLPEAVWRDALDQVVVANPGIRLHMVGRRRQARWHSDSPPPLRMVRDCTWDGRTEAGADFIYATPLMLGAGPTCELVVAEAPAPERRCFVILRILHAVTDGRGMSHLLEELFRALRGEPLVGINTGASSLDLLRSMRNTATSPKLPQAAPLTAPVLPAGTRVLLRRITLQGPQPAILARVAVAVAAYAHRHSRHAAVLAVPVDLRRHAPQLTSSLLYSGMLGIALQRGDGVEAFTRKLRQLLDDKCDAVYKPAFEWLRRLPLPWVNYLFLRLPRQLWPGRVFLTALVSNIGRLDMSQWQCPGLQVETVYSIPVIGVSSALPSIVLYGPHDRVEISIGFPDSAGSSAALDDFTDFLRERLAADQQAPAA